MHMPPSTTTRNLEDAIIDKFRLWLGNVSITRHRQEVFLIRFQHRRHYKEVNTQGKFQYCGVDVSVRPWRSLIGALGAALFYRVLICLDRVPRHAWQPNIVERIIGHTCVLQCIDTNLLHLTDTHDIELWAWSADPSKIPKVMWLIITTGTMDGSSSSVQVSEVPPSCWYRVIKHYILVHIWEIHNYSIVAMEPRDPDVPIDELEKWQLPWFWGVRDGEQAPTHVFPPFQP